MLIEEVEIQSYIYQWGFPQQKCGPREITGNIMFSGSSCPFTGSRVKAKTSDHGIRKKKKRSLKWLWQSSESGQLPQADLAIILTPVEPGPSSDFQFGLLYSFLLSWGQSVQSPWLSTSGTWLSSTAGSGLPAYPFMEALLLPPAAWKLTSDACHFPFKAGNYWGSVMGSCKHTPVSVSSKS